MKVFILLSTLILGLCASSHGALYTFTDSTPDGSGGGSITDAPANVRISSGQSDDLQAYLNHDGMLVPLLARAQADKSCAFDSSSVGMNITLANGPNLHFSKEKQTTGEWSSEGPRTSSPSERSALTRSSVGSMPQNEPNAGVTFADAAGSEQSPTAGWSLEIVAVPEPVNVALGIFGGIVLAVNLCRSERLRKLFCKRMSFLRMGER
jgi:hypothetical protein